MISACVDPDYIVDIFVTVNIEKQTVYTEMLLNWFFHPYRISHISQWFISYRHQN